MHDCEYDTIKVLHELSLLNAYLEKHAKKNAKGKYAPCKKKFDALQKDVKKHMTALHADLKKMKI